MTNFASRPARGRIATGPDPSSFDFVSSSVGAGEE